MLVPLRKKGLSRSKAYVVCSSCSCCSCSTSSDAARAAAMVALAHGPSPPGIVVDGDTSTKHYVAPQSMQFLRTLGRFARRFSLVVAAVSASSPRGSLHMATLLYPIASPRCQPPTASLRGTLAVASSLSRPSPMPYPAQPSSARVTRAPPAGLGWFCGCQWSRSSLPRVHGLNSRPRDLDGKFTACLIMREAEAAAVVAVAVAVVGGVEGEEKEELYSNRTTQGTTGEMSRRSEESGVRGGKLDCTQPR